MKKISLRLRIAILTSILIAITSISLNFFTNKTAYFYIDSLGGFMDNAKEDDLYINIDKDNAEDFENNFSNQINITKTNFTKNLGL